MSDSISVKWSFSTDLQLEYVNAADLKRKVDVIYEALKLLLGEDLEKAVEKVEKGEVAKRSKLDGQK